MANGIYTIDPDGAGGADAFDVTCNMEADGGGWTRVFLAQTSNYSSGTQGVAYTTDSLALRENATEALIAYGDGNGNLSNRAFFPIPVSWVSKSPMQYSKEGVSVQATVNGAYVGAKNLYFGTCDYQSPCANNWGGCSANWLHGRVCLQGTEAPYWAFWAGPNENYPDSCPPSNLNGNPWWKPPCSASRKFAIYVR